MVWIRLSRSDWRKNADGIFEEINKNVTGLYIEKVEDLEEVVKMLCEKQ